MQRRVRNDAGRHNTMTRNETLATPRGERWFWPAWGAAFLGFPIGGAAATLLVGPIDTVGGAAIGGAVAGAVIGAAQWLVLRRRLPLSVLWVPVTAGGMALGLALAHVVLGDGTTTLPLLLRGLIVGAVIGAVQAALLRRVLPIPTIWAAVVAVGWALAWPVSAAIGLDLTLKWAVFGASGALAFQLATGLMLAYLLRQSAVAVAPVAARGSMA
jgi:hypothetical protein